MGLAHSIAEGNTPAALIAVLWRRRTCSNWGVSESHILAVLSSEREAIRLRSLSPLPVGPNFRALQG